MANLSDVKAAQPDWFSRGNKRFFGDVSYRVLHGKATKKPFLVRESSMWSDMLGKPKTYFWKVNPLDDQLKIRPLIGTDFKSLDAVREWLKYQ